MRNKSIVKNCLICSKLFIVQYYRRSSAKYCSGRCRGKFVASLGKLKSFKKGNIPVNKGIPMTDKQKFLLSKLLTGRTSNNGSFKPGSVPANKGVFNEKVTYNTIHRYFQIHNQKSGLCTRCGRKAKTHWANITGIYTRNIQDYQELCPSCHWKEDKANPKHAPYQRGILI